MEYYVYILYSAQLDLFYIGSSENPEKRLSKHLASHKGFTGKVKDWKLCFTETFTTKSAALHRKTIKNWKNRERIQQLIAGKLKKP
ncbi:GIY-YIG nuclease family protein [Longitalea luteola]|uniref:GIY-YIG nuclease family protein n=1 Tax=Longitalea luteola TaxID=2812563 RepID=UPI001A957EEF|nr:GIY-YIG nuclease family protein [Longitalea luteola]